MTKLEEMKKIVLSSLNYAEKNNLLIDVIDKQVGLVDELFDKLFTKKRFNKIVIKNNDDELKSKYSQEVRIMNQVIDFYRNFKKNG